MLLEKPYAHGNDDLFTIDPILAPTKHLCVQVRSLLLAVFSCFPRSQRKRCPLVVVDMPSRESVMAAPTPEVGPEEAKKQEEVEEVTTTATCHEDVKTVVVIGEKRQENFDKMLEPTFNSRVHSIVVC